MKFVNIGKNAMKVTLVCLMLTCIFSRIDIKTSEAALPAEYFEIEATVTDDPYWGYYGGYHDIWDRIQIELAKINITLTISQNSMYDWWYKVWDTGWNHTGGETPTPGWDVTMFEWWLQPHAVEPWFASMILNNMTPYEGGFNIHPWMNKYADELVMKALTSFDPVTRRNYFWAWQEEWLKDPPIAQVYYPRIYEATASYIIGYDSSGCWWYDARHLDINNTEFELTLNPSTGSDPNSERYAIGNDTLYYAISEEVWGYSPMYMDSYSEENFGVLCWDTLYTWSLDWTDEQWLKAGIVEPDPEDYIIVPELASANPTVLDGGTRMRVPLREGVLWSDQDPTHERAGTEMNATDVKFTYDYALNVSKECTGYGDFAYVIESVEVVPLAEGLGGKFCPYTDTWIDPFKVDFILRFPHPDFMSIVSNDWGGGSIIPWSPEFEAAYHAHPSPQLQNHKTNNPSPGQMETLHPGTGPYILTEHSTAGGYIKLEKNDLYWGTGEGYGPHVSTIYLKFVPDAGTRKEALEQNVIDFGEYPFANVSEYEDYKTWSNLKVFEYNYPASNGVWFNFNNQYLSNCYVRKAIAHAIPYSDIFSEVLPGWGVKTAYQGKTYIMPVHNYGGEYFFNTVVQPFTYDIVLAGEYMKMWAYAQPAYAPQGSPEVALGPVGDANFDGEVDFDDFFIYTKWKGYDDHLWTWDPGCDIDPDWDNSGGVSYPVDFDLWIANYRNTYP